MINSYYILWPIAARRHAAIGSGDTMADELDYNPAGIGAVGCSIRPPLMANQTTGPVAFPQPSSARGLSKSWKSLRNLLAALLSPAFKTANNEFQQPSSDLYLPSRAYARASSLRRPVAATDVTLIADRGD